MSWPSPSASPRTDLPWLRHRSAPHPAAGAGRPAALSDFVAGHGHHPGRPNAAGSTSLDLSAAPTAPSPAASAPTRVTSSATSAPADPVPAGPTPGASASIRVPVRSSPLPRRVVAGRAEVLTPRAPTVTLTRVQSGMGALVVEAACSDAVGDLRLAAAYCLSDGATSVLRHDDGAATAPARGGPPVLLVQRHQFERLTLDLRQIRRLDRLIVLAFSAGDGPLSWGGTLVTTTLGGSRVEVAMDGPNGPGVVVLLSGYVVDGELVLRAEPREVSLSIREACLAYGFDRITWLDARTPLA